MKIRYIALSGLVLLLVSITVYAIAPAGVQWVSDTSYSTVAATAAQSDTTEGGNITELNITNVNSSTERWAGYLGDTSSTGMRIVLANPALDIFYNWSWDTTQEGEVCAGIATTYSWNDLAAGTAANLDTAWGFADASDDAEATFTTSGSITIGGVTVNPVPEADTGDLPADTFRTALLVDSAGSVTDTDFVFCTDTQYGAGTGYDGSTVDYEIIVPVTYGATETYYFYVELN